MYTTTDVQLHNETADTVTYYDGGTGVYLEYTNNPAAVFAGAPYTIRIISQDGARILGELSTSARTIKAASFVIRGLITDPTKDYGDRAGLWTAGDAS